MKHLLNLSLFLLLALTTAFNAAGQASVTYNGINYTFYYSGSGASAVGDYAEVARQSTSFSGAANIASSVSYQYTYVSGYDSQGNPIYSTRNLTAPVTIIRDFAFYNCSSLTSVTIPNSVITIGERAFEDCTNLTSVTIPNSVTAISNYTFYRCSNLRSVTIPRSVTTIGEWAFHGCISLTSVTIPNSVTTIGRSAFSGCSSLTSVNIQNAVIGDCMFASCSSLTSVTIPNSVTSIGWGAFSGCTSLTSVTIPNSVTIIDESTFQNCIGLTSVSIPNSVTSIGLQAFQDCTNLTSVTIPSSVTSIGNGAFFRCISLTNVTIPNSVTSIGNGVFAYCSGLKSVTIGNSVTELPRACFWNCTSLTSVTIPNSVKTIYINPFSGCSSLTSIKVASGNSVFDSRNNCNAIIETATNTLISGCQNTIIPNSVTSIGEGAFEACTGLTSVTIPNSVTTIGNYAFTSCSSLTSVTIGNSVTSIGGTAFWGCSSLTSITCLVKTPPTAITTAYGTSYSAFDDYSASLHVPASSLYEYQTTEPWKNFYNIQPIGQEYSISLSQTSAVIEKGDFIQLRATVTPDDDYAPTVTWSSSNTAVATVDEWGIVTAVGAGNAVITAHAGNASATCSVKVVEHTVTLDQSTATIQLYSTLQLIATVTPYDGYEPTVVWSSSHPGVATVTQDGLVKGYMTGTATITARAGQSTATCVVTVIPIYATGIALNTYQEDMEVGEITRIIAYVAPNDVTNSEVSWSVTGNGVISASWNGSGNECIVIAEKAGTATVTATTTDGTNLSATCIIRVSGSEPVYIPVESISLNKSSLRMNVNSTRHLVATVLPANASNRTVTWSSSNSNVVTVDENGVVTAKRTGTATITATTNGTTANGAHLSVQCRVTVVTSGGNDDLLLGDVDGDGYINIGDVTALIRYLLSHDATGIELDNADVDGDGRYTIADVTTLINRLLKGHW